MRIDDKIDIVLKQGIKDINVCLEKLRIIEKENVKLEIDYEYKRHTFS